MLVRMIGFNSVLKRSFLLINSNYVFTLNLTVLQSYWDCLCPQMEKPVRPRRASTCPPSGTLWVESSLASLSCFRPVFWCQRSRTARLKLLTTPKWLYWQFDVFPASLVWNVKLLRLKNVVLIWTVLSQIFHFFRPGSESCVTGGHKTQPGFLQTTGTISAGPVSVDPIIFWSWNVWVVSCVCRRERSWWSRSWRVCWLCLQSITGSPRVTVTTRPSGTSWTGSLGQAL